MLKEINEMRAKYAANKDRPEIKVEMEVFVRRSTVNFIFASNQVDGVGLQSYAQTDDALAEVFDIQSINQQADKVTEQADPAIKHPIKQSTEQSVDHSLESALRARSRKETVQTFQAMQFLYNDFQKELQIIRQEVAENGGVENDGCPYANPSFALFFDDELVLLPAHRHLTTDLLLSSQTGKFCKGHVQAGSFFFQWAHHYPPSDSIELSYLDLTNTLAALLLSLPGSTADNYVELCFKLAAWLMFEFVDLHPFTDGNGRMCRLLANRMLYLVCPFPVAPVGAYNYVFEPVELKRELWLPRPGNEKYQTKRTATSVQDHYWAAIETCRYGTADVKSNEPADLCALLIENAWAQWKQLFEDTLSPYFSVSC